MRIRTCLAILVLTALPVSGQVVAVKHLVPVATDLVEGANGSVWSTTLSIANTGADLLSVQYPFVTDCPFICGPQSSFVSDPGRAVALTSTKRATVGAFLYLRGDGAAVTLRSQDLSRQSETWGTSIPVVARKDLLGMAIGLIDIPLEPQFRSRLRIYDYNPETPGAVTVTLSLIREGPTGLQQLEQVFEDRFEFPFEPLPDVYPGAIQIALDPLVGEEGNYLVEIVPDDDSVEYWAFVSVTHNETHHVTLITPGGLEPETP